MVDYILFECILSKEEDGYIEENDFIDLNTMKLLSCSNQAKVRKLFKKTSNTVPAIGYNCEFICEKCNCDFVKSLSKTELFKVFSYISKRKICGMKPILCERCQKERDEQEKRERQLSNMNESEKRFLNTERYIDIYLNPDNSWKEGIKPYQKINYLSPSFYQVNWNDIIKHIKSMDYYEFLNTPYWKAIAERVKYKAGYRCQMCNSSENLITHHRTYENHGDEIHHVEDLICICKDCHEKHHFE